MTSPTEPLAPLTDEELDVCEAAYCRESVVAPIARALAELRRLRASEEAHRRGAEGFEEMAGAWLGMNVFRDETGAEPQAERDWVKSLASLLATVHRDAMEKAAGIAAEWIGETAARELGAIERRKGASEAAEEIAAAIRRAAAEAK